MTNKSKQHYVPQFYLKNFALRKTKRGKKQFSLHCFDKDLSKYYITNIKNIAQEKEFYDFGDLSLEKSLSAMESIHSSSIRKIIENPSDKILINLEFRHHLSEFLSLQLMRTKETRESINEMLFKLSKDLYELNGKNMDSNLEKDMDTMIAKSLLKPFHLDLISGTIEKFSSAFTLKKWCLLENKTKIPFWTSDNPLVQYNTKTKHVSRGIIVPYSKIFFPISSNLCLCFLDPENFSSFKIEEKFTNIEDIMYNIKTPEYCVIDDVNDIKFLNILQAKGSTRHIFSKSPENFSTIDKLIKEGKVLKNKDKQRVFTGKDLFSNLNNKKSKN